MQRIEALAIPPAWHDVWICASPRGHIQATGRDARGRKQYIYHPDWRTHRDGEKFESLAHFARLLPRIRNRAAADLGAREMSRERVLAATILLLDITLIRVGNESYQKSNGSYGLTTLLCNHAEVDGTGIEFVFNGKSGREHRISARDRRVARVLRECQELPGQELLKYIDDAGEVRSISSEDVNRYLREAAGEGITAKTFRTWGASVLMARELARAGAPTTEAEARKNVRTAIAAVAASLGNTPAVCRESYVHPDVARCYLEGTFPHWARSSHSRSRSRLSADEQFLLRVLRHAGRSSEGQRAAS